MPEYEDVESCDTYTLPELTLEGSVINYYRQPNKVDLIDPAEYTIAELGTQTIYVHAYANDNETCNDEKQFDLTIHPLLDLEIEGGILCIDAETNQTVDPFVLESGLDPAIFTVNWYLNDQLVGTGPNYAATSPGIYTVETIKLTQDVGADCNYKPTQVEVKGSIPRATITFLTSPFKVPANIRVDFIDEGYGEYEYRLNNGSYQKSNLFHDLGFGEHTVYIRDISGICSMPIAIDFKVMNYPHFFTPNNDSDNETWNIPDLADYPDAEIKIYDRYGKFIQKIKPSDGGGWDGLFTDGFKAPTTDYWFTVTFVFQGAPVSYTANFSLIR